MTSRGAKWWYPLEQAGWTIVASIVVPLYKLLFGWWLDKHFVRKHERRLVADVSLSLRFLFTDLGGRVVPNDREYPPIFDYAVVIVGLSSFYIRFIRGRGELRVDVGPPFPPSDWHDLSLVLSAITGSTAERRPFENLWDVSRALQTHMNELARLFSGDQFVELKHRLEEEIYRPERNSTRVAEAEINWRLYGDRR
jgi:hypothetical protein